MCFQALTRFKSVELLDILAILPPCARDNSRESVKLFDAVTFFADDRRMAARILNPEEQECAFELGISGDTLTKTAEILGFTSKMAFHRYCLKHPDFASELQAARNAGNGHIEDELRHLMDNETNPHRARVKADILCRLLAFRDPGKYATNRMELNVTQTVDIGSSLARMQARLSETYAPQQLDVTPKVNDINELL
jgi:hypothetical protein